MELFQLKSSQCTSSWTWDQLTTNRPKSADGIEIGKATAGPLHLHSCAKLVIASTIGLPAYKQPAFVCTESHCDIVLVIYVKSQHDILSKLGSLPRRREKEEEASVSLLVTPLQYQLN